MRKLLLFLAAAGFLADSAAVAQQTIPLTNRPPDCYFQFGPLTVTGAGFSYDNRISGCSDWAITYNSQGFASLSIVLQSAPTAALNVPGTFVTFSGTIISGSNPNTNIVKAETKWTGGYNGWVRVNLTATTGAGSIYGEVHGWRAIPSAAVTATISGNVPVVGPDAAGAPSTTNPVQVAGNDGTNVVRLKVNSGGGPRPAVVSTAIPNADPDTNILPQGVDSSNAPQTIREVVRPFLFNGATWDKALFCKSKATFNLSGSGNTQIIAASASAVIFVCYIDLSTTATEDIKFTSGTGANCVTGNADETGLYKSVQSFTFNYTAQSPLILPASAAMCINQSAAQAAGGTVIYAQFVP